MRFGLVSHLITHPGFEDKGAAVGQFGMEFTLDAQQDMPLDAPMIGDLARRIIDHAHPEIAKLAGTPQGMAALARVLGWF